MLKDIASLVRFNFLHCNTILLHVVTNETENM